MTIGVEEDVV